MEKNNNKNYIRLCLNQFVRDLICPHFSAPLFPPDYPYCLTGKELRGVIKGLIGRCSDILPDFFDYCVYTMLRELDRNSGKKKKCFRHLLTLCSSPCGLIHYCYRSNTVSLTSPRVKCQFLNNDSDNLMK